MDLIGTSAVCGDKCGMGVSDNPYQSPNLVTEAGSPPPIRAHLPQYQLRLLRIGATILTGVLTGGLMALALAMVISLPVNGGSLRRCLAIWRDFATFVVPGTLLSLAPLTYWISRLGIRKNVLLSLIWTCLIPGASAVVLFFLIRSRVMPGGVVLPDDVRMNFSEMFLGGYILFVVTCYLIVPIGLIAGTSLGMLLRWLQCPPSDGEAR